ncbi:3-hydroxyisobutyryl-CoA hydrolase 1 [Zea mays]|uniref:3-hydroxyisobutyryl-CoA hydrolase n=2 Tax=Zea mays TaxID=4577 RepID=A0A8J8YE75_MAIZE|nr:3-hydroxyisobutyryl-CoA hydrolase 1 [Zea mays]PWZ43960.1 3-hydroxyisobutyryl-CoA hydrolase 1 [Zea mays]
MATLPREGAAAADSDQLLVEAHGSTRTLILNRPKQLNALSSEMIKGLLWYFTAFEKDDGVRLLIMKGNRRVFCSGGDIAQCARCLYNGNWKWVDDFFQNEYLLNYIIATYIKPQVSILSGIVMGGGAGVSIHGRFRVATDNTIFAMPETALGLFPDVGASYFLSRLPGFYGEYVGLTGARLDGAEMLACGLATHFVPSKRLPLLEESLKKLDTSSTFAVSGIIDQFSQRPLVKDSSSLNRMETINKCFSKRTVEEIIDALEQEISNVSDKWVAATIKSLKKASPTSLKISLRSGFRAVLLEKDNKPEWIPPRLEQVPDEAVEQYFLRIDDPQWEDLNLPARLPHRRNIESKI